MLYDHYDFEVAEDAPFDPDTDDQLDVVEAMDRDEDVRLAEGFALIDQEG